MPSRRLPNTTSAVVRSLTSASEAWSQFPGNRLITPAHWAKLDPTDPASLLSRLRKEAGDVPLALATQAPLTDAFGKLLARLTLHVSHFHQVLDFAIDRGVIPAASRAFYDRDLTATTLPPLGTGAEVMAASASITTGETARATAEGTSHVPMALPSAAQVTALRQETAAARAASETAKLYTDTQQGELATLYPEAQALAVSLINTIEYQLGERLDLDAPGRRRIARAWGVVYINDDGTVNEETAPVTPTPPTP
jgi:hypothetical protein